MPASKMFKSRCHTLIGIVSGLAFAGAQAFFAPVASAADVTIVQESQLNILSAVQNDPVNRLKVTQSGRMNGMSIRQEGEANSLSALQNGTENLANITQRGSRLSANALALRQSAQTETTVSQIGSTISHMTITDPNAINYATVYQTGGLSLISLTPFAPSIGVMGRAH